MVNVGVALHTKKSWYARTAKAMTLTMQRNAKSAVVGARQKNCMTTVAFAQLALKRTAPTRNVSKRVNATRIRKALN